MIIIDKDVWRNSPLSIAKYSGGCIVNGKKFVVDEKSGALVAIDFLGLINAIGVETVCKAVDRYGEIRALAVCKRLKSILRVRKRDSICNDPVLF